MSKKKKNEIDVYTEARRRSTIASEMAVETLFGMSHHSRTEHEKAQARVNSARYARTEKGKKTNVKKCRTYQRMHPDKVYGYVKKWRKKFEEKYCMKYVTYLYRKRHGLPVPTPIIKKAPA